MKITRREIIEKATEVFGSHKDGTAWLNRPAMALEQRSTASLLRSAEGRRDCQEFRVRRAG